MAEYNKLKVDELQGILKERNLAHTGKKADLIKRLEDDDATEKAAAKTGGAEDEIDWDDDTHGAATAADAATTQPAAAAMAAGGTTQPANPRAVPNQIPAENVADTNDLSVKAPGPASGILSTAPSAATAEEPKSTIPLATIQDEMAKRRARHAKFGTDANADERLKALERQAKFGGSAPAASNTTSASASASASDEKMIRGLNSSLDDLSAERKRKSASSADRADGRRAAGAGAGADTPSGSSGGQEAKARRDGVDGGRHDGCGCGCGCGCGSGREAGKRRSGQVCERERERILDERRGKGKGCRQEGQIWRRGGGVMATDGCNESPFEITPCG